jgi:hypothetical protein
MIHFDSFSRAYNKWLDYASEVRHDYAGEDNTYSVLNIILGLLVKNIDLPDSDESHPFQRYASLDKTAEENFNALAADVMAEVQEPSLRGIVWSFFHSAGINIETTNALLDMYDSFVAESEDEVLEEGTQDDDDEEEAEDEAQSDNDEDDDDEEEAEWWTPLQPV